MSGGPVGSKGSGAVVPASDGLVANVAFDMFADPDAAACQSETTAQTEIMIWVGRIGGPQPVGSEDEGLAGTLRVGDADL